MPLLSGLASYLPPRRSAEPCRRGESDREAGGKRPPRSRRPWRLLHPAPLMSFASFLSPPGPRPPCARVWLPPPSATAAARPSLGFGPRSRRAAPAKVRRSIHSILAGRVYWAQLNLRDSTVPCPLTLLGFVEFCILLVESGFQPSMFVVFADCVQVRVLNWLNKLLYCSD